MAALDFPDTPAVGELYGSSGTVWRWDGARWASTAGASGARGVVANPGLVPGAPATITYPSTLIVTNPCTINAVAGRTYRTVLLIRAVGISPVAGVALAKPWINGAVQSDRYTWIGGSFTEVYTEYTFVAATTGAMTVAWTLLPIASGVSLQAYLDGSFYVEDITYEAGSSPSVAGPYRSEFQGTFTTIATTVSKCSVAWSADDGRGKPWPNVVSVTQLVDTAGGNVYQFNVGPAVLSAGFWYVDVFASYMDNSPMPASMVAWVRAITHYGPKQN